MSDTIFQFDAPGVDAGKIVSEIRERVAAKKAEGAYTDPRVARAERTNLANLKEDKDFMEFYLQCLREAVFVDIGDFEITERRNRFRFLLVRTKRTIWKLLKFYTYRMWSQQNQVNGMLLGAIESIETTHRDQIQTLSNRIDELEKRSADSSSLFEKVFRTK